MWGFPAVRGCRHDGRRWGPQPFPIGECCTVRIGASWGRYARSNFVDEQCGMAHPLLAKFFYFLSWL